MEILQKPMEGRRGVAPGESGRYGLIDWAKFVMSLYVVGCHCDVWNNLGEGLLGQSRELYGDIPILTFFVMSGFFLLGGVPPEDREGTDRRLTKHLHGTIKVYLFWTALYLPYAFWGNLMIAGNSLPKAVVKTLWRIAMVGSNYNSWQLWYLLGLIVSVWIIRLGLRHGAKLWQITAFGAAFCLLGFYLNTVRDGGAPFPAAQTAVNIYFQLFSDTRNGLLNGLVYVCAGVLLSRREIPGAVFWAGAAASGGLVILAGDQFLPRGLGIMCAVACVFGILKSVDMPVTPASRMFREMSRYVYLSHMLFYGVIEPLAAGSSCWTIYGLTVAASVLFSAALAAAMNYRKRKMQ